MKLQSIDHLNITVASLEESTSFYERLFGFSVVERGSYNGTPWAIARSGDSMLCMYEHPRRETPSGASDQHHRINHFGFRIANGAGFEEVLDRNEVVVEYGTSFRRPHSTSWYVRDPSGHEIEVTHWDDNKVAFDKLA